LDEQRAYHRQSHKNKNTNFKFQTSLVPVHIECLLSVLLLIFAR
jgi:hypothetical protein